MNNQQMVNRKDEGYFVEYLGGAVWQSVFPSAQAEHSQLHTNIHDAAAYIREQAGNVPITVLPAKAPEAREEG